MRTLFWRILATFWLAIVLVAVLSLLLGRALNQDEWILSHYPAINGLPQAWADRYEAKGPQAAQQLLEARKRRFRLDIQVIGESGQPLVSGTFSSRAAAFEARHRDRQLPWRQLTHAYTSESGANYLFIYRIANNDLAAWRRTGLFGPLSALGIALAVVTVFSLLLTLSITRPLNRLRGAVHDLGQTAYQQNSLAQLATRRDELGLLASDFNLMGQRLQGLIASQRQLLRDVSHELRSPLARLRMALGLAERADDTQRQHLWPRLAQECDRLEALISEILALARLDADPGASSAFALAPLLKKIQDDARLLAPDKPVTVTAAADLELTGWPDMLERALDNLARNAQRFSAPHADIDIRAERHAHNVSISVRDHGPGVAPEHLPRLGEAFYRAPGQQGAGHGLGLAIARRAAQRHGGELELANHPDGGFVATLHLPINAR